MFHSVSNRAHRKRLRNSISSAAWYARYIFFLVSSKRLYDIHVTWLTDFYVERVTAHRIKIDDSCFHNRWPNSKTKPKIKHLWEQGGPLVFRGPTQLAYSAYREDRRWVNLSNFKGTCISPTSFHFCIAKTRNRHVIILHLHDMFHFTHHLQCS